MNKWHTLSEDEVVTAIAGRESGMRKQRLDAYEEAQEHLRARDAAQKSILVVPRESTLQLTIPASLPGVHFIDIIQEQSSRLELTCTEEPRAESNGILYVRLKLDKGARCISHAAFLNGAPTLFFQETILEGEGSSIDQRTVFFANGQQRCSIFSSTMMRNANASAAVTTRGIVTDQAHARFDGLIDIGESAPGANAHLTEHTLLLSTEARMNAIPALKIATNEVTAGHSASVTRVDDEQLFYFLSRGIPGRTAVKLIAEGFLTSVLSEHPRREELTAIISAKLK